MTEQTRSTRRSFLKFGAIGAPFAAAAAAGAARAEDPAAARLARLEDLNAIRDLNQRYVRGVNARAAEDVASLFADPKSAALDDTVRRLAAEDALEESMVEIAEDGRTAVANLACVADTETPVTPHCPLVDMAREMGEGVVRASGRRVLTTRFEKQADGAWKIAAAELQTA